MYRLRYNILLTGEQIWPRPCALPAELRGKYNFEEIAKGPQTNGPFAMWVSEIASVTHRSREVDPLHAHENSPLFGCSLDKTETAVFWTKLSNLQTISDTEVVRYRAELAVVIYFCTLQVHFKVSSMTMDILRFDSLCKRYVNRETALMCTQLLFSKRKSFRIAGTLTNTLLTFNFRYTNSRILEFCAQLAALCGVRVFTFVTTTGKGNGSFSN